MLKTIAIKPVHQVGPMMVTWDLGRRCNYDCSYCLAIHHNNYSRHRTLEECKSVFDFIQEYTDIYNTHRNTKFPTTINFTGGEPTVNPNFWDILEYIKERDPSTNLSLTTNGAFNKKYIEYIEKYMSGVTVSYHTEADPTLKQQVIDNILAISDTNVWMQVNLMMHVDYWDEVVSVYNQLTDIGVLVKLRPIGDGGHAVNGWVVDSDGAKRKTTHEYSEEQQEWFFKQHGKDYKTMKQNTGYSLGRQCCGNRKLCGKVDDTWQDVTLVNTEFKDWSCMVDWYFLHIDHETELVYHNQNCRAKHGKQVGAIGSLSDTKLILDSLNQRLNKDIIEPIICPNIRCGCGMCVPKAKDPIEFELIFNQMR